MAHRDPDSRYRRILPAWLVGLLIAIVIFGVGLLVFNALGLGDDPTLGDPDANASAMRAALAFGVFHL